MENPKVFVAIPVYGWMPAQFVQSLMHLQAKPPCNLAMRVLAGDSLVARARNTLSAEFIASDCTHLLFLDSDLVFSPEHIRRLVDHGKDLVAGFYPKKQEGELAWVCNAKLEPNSADDDGLQEVRYMGTGFMLISRTVFERMIDVYGMDIEYRPDARPETVEWDFWSVGPYKTADGFSRYLSEDWYFCQRWLDLGGKVYGDTRVIAKHVGHAVYPLESQMSALKVIQIDSENAQGNVALDYAGGNIGVGCGANY